MRRKHSDLQMTSKSRQTMNRVSREITPSHSRSSMVLARVRHRLLTMISKRMTQAPKTQAGLPLMKAVIAILSLEANLKMTKIVSD